MRSLLVFAVLIASAFAKSKNLVSLHEENWTAIMKGEWMVEFHAPWCPACKDLQKAWNSFADYSRELGINVAEVDVTVNPGLSGRFLVTALPTIYHVKDGVFRVYSGPRDKHDFIEFIEERKWSTVTPVPDYKHPNSHQMAVVAVFFKLSMSVRDLHNHLVEVKGIPAAASYALFAGVTLALGCVLGFLIVLVIDQVFPTGAAKAAKKAEQNKKKENNKKKEAEKKKEQEKAQNSATEDSADETKDDKVRNRKTENQNNNQKKEKETPKNEGKKVK